MGTKIIRIPKEANFRINLRVKSLQETTYAKECQCHTTKVEIEVDNLAKFLHEAAGKILVPEGIKVRKYNRDKKPDLIMIIITYHLKYLPTELDTKTAISNTKNTIKQ